jgi:ATP-dependent RNA helicase DHX57
MHPASVAFACGSFPSGWCVYTQLSETSKVYAREVSMVPVYALLLFGGRLAVQHEEGTLTLDGWARFRAPAKIGTLVSV